MYACIPENGGGLFEGVCPLSSATAHLHDPPPPLDSRISSPETFHPDACVAIAQLRCLMVLRGRLGTQPQGDVGGLHRLPYHTHEIIAKRVQVCLVAQLGREGFQGFGSVVFAAVEATVDKALDAPSDVAQ